MPRLLLDLMKNLSHICPAYLHVPMETAYPYITLEPKQTLVGLPWGPQIVTFAVKVWSRYAGTQEIFRLIKGVEDLLLGYAFKTGGVSLKILESTFVLLADKETRLHTFHLKARVEESRDE